jgi:phage terminase large subunit GpA-like protein
MGHKKSEETTARMRHPKVKSPCPHCGFMQTLKFKQIKWSENATADEARDIAYYECEKCNGRITDSAKMQMLRCGEWKAIKKTEKPRKVSFRINTLYSPWVRFGDVAYEFLKSIDFPELLQNFINSWLAEPWQETRQKMDSDVIKERQSEYTEGVVPPNILGLTGGADIQGNHIYWTVRAWGEGLTSWNVAHGIVPTLDKLYDVMNTPYMNTDNKPDYVQLCCIDSGDQTDTIYDFVAENSDWSIPIKGSSRQMLQRFKISSIDKVNSKANGLRLVIVNTGDYKNSIAARMNKPNGKGSWMVYNGVDEEYCKQVTAEHKVVERKGGKEIETWQPKTSHADNHYLDCEVYAFVAADLLQYRYITLEEDKPNEVIKPKQEQSKDKWIETKGDWLNV